MVVDDQPGIRRLVYEVLNQAGYNVTLATNGKEALTKIAVEKPELIILDMKMPGMNGVDFLKELRSNSYDMPVIVITAYSEMNVMNKTWDLGTQYFLQKPFDIFKLYQLVCQILPPPKNLRHELV